MSGFPTVNFSDSDQGLFTPAEIRRLMRVEFDRARRYGYPIVCMLIEVDRLESLHDLYGYESKEEVQTSVIGLMRTMTRASDFLGCMQADRIMAMFPHTDRRVASRLAERLLRGARKLRFDSDGRTLRTTLSIGLSWHHPGMPAGYEQFVAAAEEALDLALRAGGDRFVARDAMLREEVVELRADLEAEAIALQEGRGGPGAAKPLSIDPAASLEDKVRQLFAELGPRTPELEELERQILSLTAANLAASEGHDFEHELAERDRRVEQLERRVKKLVSLLDVTEAELRRIASMKDVDPGIASIYRTVQGLAPEEREYEMKKQLMTEIFKANVALKNELDSLKQRRNKES